MAWIVVAWDENQYPQRVYYGPFETEDKAKSYVSKCQEQHYCAFAVRLEKPIVE